MYISIVATAILFILYVYYSINEVMQNEVKRISKELQTIELETNEEVNKVNSAIFRLYDRNKDNTLDQKEFNILLAHLG